MIGTIAVPERDRLDEARLGAWMETNVAGFAGPPTLSKFAGGQSNPTYRIDSASGSYVLRRKPFGQLLPSAHAVDREFAVISGLYPTGFPVPRPYALCTDIDVIGSVFYIMALAHGRNLWDGGMPGVAPEDRRDTYHAIIDTLAALHTIDPVAVGLGDYGKPGDYFARQIGRWTKQYRASETEPLAAMDRLIEWLPATMPTQDRIAIVHGDYRIDNMILADDTAQVVAVLDWELSTLGDPMADFTYFLMAWMTPLIGTSTVVGLDQKALGIPTLDEAVARYCAATGRDGIPDLNWYAAYNLFRFTAIVQGIKKRVLEGTASSAQAAARADKVAPLAEAGWAFAVKAGASG